MTARAPGGHRLRRLAVSVGKTDPFLRALAALPGRGAVVLRYHSVNDDPVWARECVQRSLVVPSAVFDAQVKHLVERYRVVDIGEIVRGMLDGRGADRRTVAITFDDGYEDNYRNALPVLARHGVPGAFYVTTGAVGDAAPLWTVELRRAVMRAAVPSLDLSFRKARPLDVSTDRARERAVAEIAGHVKRCAAPEAASALEEVFEATGWDGSAAWASDRRVMMSWDEIRGMRRAGMTVGAHSVSHPNLPSLSDADLEREVRASRETLSRELGEPVEHFAYPNGRTDRHCDARVARAVAAAGYASAVTSVTGPASGRWSPFAVPRLGVYGRHEDVARLSMDIQVTRLGGPSDPCIARIARELADGRKSGRGAADGRGRRA